VDDLVMFVRACLDEDERAWEMVAARGVVQLLHGEPLAPRMLADVAAKRAILDLHKNIDGLCDRCYMDTAPCETVGLLAQPYAGRPGWREEWAT
jgi:hypothetical protein